MKRMIPLLLLPLLASCATPRESCLSSAQKELATIDKLIVETQGNLQRGYAIDREYYTSSRVDLCMRGGRHRVGWSYCTVPTTRVREKPVTIDRATEQRKLAELQQARKRAAEEARNKVAYCEAKYPAQ